MKARDKGEVFVTMGLRIPPRLKEAVKQRAIEERRSVNDQAIVLLEKGLKQEDKDDIHSPIR